MRKIIYYVATSLDGFIAGPANDISLFVSQGEGVQRYLADLKEFDTVIMGRKTYEFGYDFGLQPGQPAYPHMQHYIFSNNLELPGSNDQVRVVPPDIEIIKELKAQTGSKIYLCGGGYFAGWLLNHQMIDELKIKLNPIILADGVRLFERSVVSCRLREIEAESYSDGLHFKHYSIEYL